MSDDFQTEVEPIDPTVETLNEHFRLAEQFIKGWSGGFLEVALRRAELATEVHQVILAQCVRQLRTLRSVTEICRLGDSVSGGVLVRSMWETAVLTGFIMKPNWLHVVRGKKEKLDATLRAQLVLLRDQVQIRNRIDRTQDKSLKKSQAQWMLLQEHSTLEALSAQVGSKWSKVVDTDPPTVTGQSLEEIAPSISPELAAWYSVVEGTSPQDNLATHSQEFLQKNIDGMWVSRWESSPSTTLAVLRNALYLTLTTLSFVDAHADIGIGGRSMLSGLRSKLTSIS